MKKILTTLALLVATTILLAQVPQKFSYQGVIRDAAGNLVRNAPVGVRVSLLKASADGVAVYCETHQQTTNANGLLTLTIGDGTVVGGDIAAIDWAGGPYFLKTETDITGGSNYTLVGAQQLLSVPYALYAGNTTNGFSGDYNDLSNKPEIPAAQENADWKATEGVAEILNKPTKVSDFENDAHYLTNLELAEQLAEMQKQLDSLKAATGNGYSTENDGKPCQGVDTITDIDGNKYPTVQIGKQCWMAENLKTQHYTSGETYEKCRVEGEEVYYSHDIHLDDYGLCPSGWHVPYTSEWQQLVQYVAGNYGQDKKYLTAKALASNEQWIEVGHDYDIGRDPETNNTSAFNAKPVGYMFCSNTYTQTYAVSDYGRTAAFLALYHDPTPGHYIFWIGGDEYTGGYVNLKDVGSNILFHYTIRCLKD